VFGTEDVRFGVVILTLLGFAAVNSAGRTSEPRRRSYGPPRPRNRYAGEARYGDDSRYVDESSPSSPSSSNSSGSDSGYSGGGGDSGGGGSSSAL
jgi:uncharacterized membrane protein YgcG